MKTLQVIIMILVASAVVDAQTTDEKMRFLDSLNKYRIQAGVRPYKYDFYADRLAALRVETINSHIDDIGDYNVSKNKIEHLHYCSDEDYTTYNRFLIQTKKDSIGWNSECTAHLKFWKPKKPYAIVDEIFTGWKNSPEHWRMMMNPDLQYLSIAWTYKNSRLVACLVIFDLLK